MLVGDHNETALNQMKYLCLTLFIYSRNANGMQTLADLERMPSDLASMIPKSPWLGWYLPHPLVAALVLAYKYLSLRRIHPSYPYIQYVMRLQLDSYLLSCSYVKGRGISLVLRRSHLMGILRAGPRFALN